MANIEADLTVITDGIRVAAEHDDRARQDRTLALLDAENPVQDMWREIVRSL